jgi:Asp-tRNA(Asn)/Glu-tRNA(Gln) amidotransferase A subunit family amidase
VPATVVSGLRAYSLGQARDALDAGDFSAAEYLAQTRSEISRLEPDLRAFISLTGLTCPPARGRAGALTGLTFSVKDTIEVAGAPTTAGSRLLREHVPARTAGVVRRLQAAGAVLAGKTNCAEFGIGNLETNSPVRGQTRNPWSPGHTPGGSSGGDSAAVASGLVTFGVATDYGGSVRFPAHCTGIAALRPTPGRLPLDGQLPQFAAEPPPTLPSRTQRRLQTPGFLTRSARDLRTLLAVTAGDALRPPRVHRVAWFADEVSDEVAEVVANAAHALAERGAHVAELPPPDVAGAVDTLAQLRAAEGLPEIGWLSDGREELLSPLVRHLLTLGTPPLPPGIAGRLRDWETWQARLFADVDVVLTPAAAGPAFPVDPDWRLDRTALDRHLRLATLLAVPAVVVPCGTSAGGLPIGVQVMAGRGRDEDAIETAIRLETAFGRWNPPSEAR